MSNGLAAQSRESGEREKRIREILDKMTLSEKIGQMTACSLPHRLIVMLFRYNYWVFESGRNRKLGIKSLKFTDGPHGVSINKSTCFPVSMCRGAAFDAELEERVGDVIGIEARSQGADHFGGVCINVLRHPGWGRAQETYGEDPHHLGVMGVALTRGVQRHMMACAKHYACNSIEESRYFVDVKADERTLREIYLPHFKKCVDAGVASFMSAYNKVNGHLCGHNEVLLKKILKQDWGFEGFVVSDFIRGVKNTVRAANAGLDIEMPVPIFYGLALWAAVKRGKVPMHNIDDSVLRVLRMKDKFSKVGVPGAYDKSKVACKDHTNLALEAARKGIVLLKNENGALPIEREKVKTIAVVGRLADYANLGDYGSSRVRPPYAITPLAGIRNRGGDKLKIVYASGKNLAEAKQAAKSADAVVVVAGLKWPDEGEFWVSFPSFKSGRDRINLDLSKDQEELILAVASENKRCVVVLEGGSAITMERWKDKVAAILMAWYPGMEGGTAIAEILFGDVNPSGKLPMVFPKSTDQLPFFDNKVKEIDYGYYHGYRLFEKKYLEPLFPFGFGLSYTTFKYGNLKLSSKQIAKSGKIIAAVDVTNTGKMAGDEIVQLYVGYNGSKVDRPVKDLKAFARVALKPGETRTATLTVQAEDLAYYNVEKSGWEIEEIEYIVYVGPSSRQQDLISDSFKISGT